MAYDEAQSWINVEEKLTWGVHLFRGLLSLEARSQAHSPLKDGEAAGLSLELMPMLYRSWLDASEFFLETAKRLAGKGYAVDGMLEFEATVEEARHLCLNLDLEDEIRPIEEFQTDARPEKSQALAVSGMTSHILER